MVGAAGFEPTSTVSETVILTFVLYSYMEGRLGFEPRYRLNGVTGVKVQPLTISESPYGALAQQQSENNSLRNY